MATVALDQDVSTSNERRRVPRRPPGFAVGTLSLAQWDRSRARGRDRGRVTALWDHHRNADSPNDLSYGSGQARWFCCEQGHPPWQARVNALTSVRRDCPYCAGKRVAPGMNDLATMRPDLLSEWHPTRNRTLSPAQVTPGSHGRAWWCCSSCGWEWSAAVGERAGHGTGCPHCAGKTVAVGIDDLATTHPELVAEWQRRRNRSLTPRHVLAESHRVVWWCCATCGHEWRTEVRLRARSGTGCPACAGSVPVRGRTFADLGVIAPGEWSARNDLAPEDYTPRSSRHVWRRCLRCGSEYEQQVRYWATRRQHRCRAATAAIGTGR